MPRRRRAELGHAPAPSAACSGRAPRWTIGFDRVTPLRAPVVLSFALTCATCRPVSDGRCTNRDHSVVFDPAGDHDGDGLDDAFEDAAARAYLPFLATHPDDACARSGLVFRARPHPDDPALLHVVYSRLYELDCGLNGHVGDNEAFGATIDPRLPPPAGLVALVAVAHDDTACERTTTCGTCAGLPTCDLHGGRPVLYASRDKHASVVDIGGGCALGSCFDSCALPSTTSELALVNVGEPGAPLVRDLTAQGFIHAELGWSEAALLNVDPWGDAVFGSAGSIAGDLDDATLMPPACTCDA